MIWLIHSHLPGQIKGFVRDLTCINQIWNIILNANRLIILEFIFFWFLNTNYQLALLRFHESVIMMKSDEDFLYVLSCWIILTPIVQYTSESDQDANCIFFQCSHVFICHRLVLLLFFGITGLIAALCLVGLFSYLTFICLICFRKAACISAQVNRAIFWHLRVYVYFKINYFFY